MRVTASLDAEQVQQIIDSDEPVLRNFWITHSYHVLSERLRQTISPAHANWCTFAKWASKSVGRAIRGETIPNWLLGVAETSPAWSIEGVHAVPPPDWLHHWSRAVSTIERTRLMAAFDALLGKVSARLAQGNLMVFAELGPLFTRFCDALVKDGNADAVVDSIEPLEPGEDVSQLQSALRHYLAARDTEGAERAVHVFTANVLVGLHEQRRLQAAIAGALDAPFHDRAAEDLFEHAAFERHPKLHAIRGHGLRSFWEHEVTMRSVLLHTPEGPLHPGADLRARPGEPLYPPELSEIKLAETLQLMSRYDRSDSRGRGTHARNWTSLEDRMNFILNLFRSRHTAVDWHQAPFTDEQVEQLMAGALPSGEL